MPTKEQPELNPLEPPEALVEEMSFANAMRSAVDDLFICQDIAERVQGAEDHEAVEKLLSHRKQVLVEHLVETAYQEVDDVITTLDTLQATPPLDETEADSPLSPPPKQRSDVGKRVA